MTPIIKYQGGKTRELKTILPMLPSRIEGRLIEPFCGGAALMFHVEQSGRLSDINKDVINLYRVVQGQEYQDLQLEVDHLKTLTHDELEVRYYKARDTINQEWGKVDDVARAVAYVTVRQLCFSGMERYNSRGQFNTPFGHYKKMACALNQRHHKFLQNVEIVHCGFRETISTATDEDFIFLDPPYLDRLGYLSGDGSNGLHEQLLECLTQTSARWLLVHSDHEFYRKQYGTRFRVCEGAFGYAQRFGKNKDHSNAAVTHLYITNY